MALKIRRSASIKVQIVTTLVVLAAFLVQPYAHLAFAAGITTSPQSQTVQATETKYSDVSASGFKTLKASFHYVAEKLEAGDNLNYGWKTATDQAQLGTIAGKGESTSDPSTDTDETGDVNNVALPTTLDNQNFQLYFANTGTTSGTGDQVDLSNISVNGTAVPATQQHAVCASGCQYTTIQAAVNGEAAGSTILVKNGTYNESVTVNKSLTLQAESTAVRVIGGPTYNQGGFNVVTNDVKIDGFTIGDASTMIGTVGIDLGSTSGATVSNNIIEHNQRGISLNGASNVTLSGNTVRDNNANPENNAGIWGDNVSGITISGSMFSGASNTSINLAGSSNVTLSGNTFTSGDNAAVLWGDSNVTLTNNAASGLGSSGFFITGTNGLTATGNNLSAPTATGKSAFSISTASGHTSSNVTLTKNTLADYTNGINVASGATSDQVQSVQNWFGAANGPSDNTTGDSSKPAANPTGTGSAVNGNANYANWCTNAACTTFSNDVPANQTVVVRPSSLNGWSSADTTAGGAVNFVADSSSPLPSGALQLTTTGTNDSKANLGKAVSFRLDQLRKLDYSTKQISASAADGDASLQLAVMLDGTTGYTNLVYEPYWNGTVQANTWTKHDVFAGKFWSSRSYGSIQKGSGGAPFYTIDDILAAYPNAQVVGYGVNVGTYNPSYTINVDGFHVATTSANTTYNFEQNLPLTAPTNLTPANGSYTNNPAFVMTWKAVSGAAGYEYRTSNTMNGTGLGPIIYSDSTTSQPGRYSEVNGTVTRSNSNTPAGTYYWQARAIDEVGTPGPWSTISRVTTDYTIPTATITAPAENGLASGHVTVKATANDTNALGAYCLKVDGGSCVSGGYVYQPANGNMKDVTIDTTSLSDGTHTLTARVTDRAGNAFEYDRHIVVDNTAPAISVNVNNGDLLRGTKTLTITLTGEAHPKIYNIRILSQDGNPVQVNSTNLGAYDANHTANDFSYNFDTTKVTDGTYTVQFSARDAAGNPATSLFRTVIVDNTAPVVAINQPAAIHSGDPVTFTGTVTGAFNTLTVAFNGKNYQLTTADVTGSDWKLMVPGSDTAKLVAEQNYPVTVSAADAAGNQSANTSTSHTTLAVQSPSTTGGGANSSPTLSANAGAQGQSVGGSTLAGTNNRNALAALLAPTGAATTGTTTPTTTDTNGNVLGTSDTKKSDMPTTNADTQGEVKGVSTTAWNIFGLAWYWWLLILAVIAGLIWWIVAARRRSSEV